MDTKKTRRRALFAASLCLAGLAACGGSSDAESEMIAAIPGGAGMPAIFFSVVPAPGTFGDLHGKVLHVDPAQYKVAVYIFVAAAGGWWIKPYFNQPLTTIRRDGTWTCDVTTGGIDERATAFAAFLLPNGYAPPLLAGAALLPPALEANAAAKVSVTR